MPRFSANLSFLFHDLPFYDRLDAAAAHGFRGVEYMFPYDYEVAQIKRRLKANKLEQVLFNLPVLDEVGYGGWVGLEYRPSKPVPETFAWIGTVRTHEVAAP